MHNDYVRPSGQWTSEMVPGASDFQRWDVLQYKGINGSDGGSWNPAKPIIIGGGGMNWDALSLTGGVTTATGGRVSIAASAGDLPRLNARSRTIQIPILSCFHIDPAQGGALQTVVSPGVGIQGSSSGTNPAFIEIPSRYMHNGARIATVALSFVVTKRPGALPASPLQFLFAGKSLSGAAVQTNPSDGVFGVGVGNIGSWAASTPYPLGQYIAPSTAAKNVGFYFKATSISGAGQSGTSEPNWASAAGIGDTITDNAGANQIVWTCTGRAGVYPLSGASVDSYYAGGAPQTLAWDFDGTTNGAYTNLVDTTQNRYQLAIENIDPTILLTGVFVTFDSITTLGFE